jgi:hypothetical protein
LECALNCGAWTISRNDRKGGAVKVDIMQILRIAFVIMLCVPVAYIAYILIDQLLDLLHPKNIGAIVKTLGSDEKKRNYLLEECRELLRSAYATKQNLTND